MKKSIFLVLLSSLLCWSCYDELNKVGPGIQPDGDVIAVFADTVTFSAVTVQTDSVYARSTGGLLGELYDEFYGSIKSDYLCQFYNPPETQVFPDSIIDEKIDSVALRIVFKQNPSWIGDSLTVMQAAVYPVIKPLALQTYTNIDIGSYYDKTPLGEKSYTVHHVGMPDSVQKMIFIPLDKGLGQRFYDEFKKDEIVNNTVFKNQASFNEFFPGVYVTTTGGVGNIVNVASTSLFIFYRINVKDTVGVDVPKVVFTQFSATTEVVQLNRVQNKDLDQMLNDASAAYMKTPAGVYTQVGIPVKAIAEGSRGRKLNNVTFKLKAYPRDARGGYGLQAPPYLLMVPSDSMTGFFERKKLTDSISFVTPFDSTKLTYDFGNISEFINNRYRNAPDEDTVYVSLVPVSIVTESGGTVTAINNYMVPSTVALKVDEQNREMRVVSSEF